MTKTHPLLTLAQMPLPFADEVQKRSANEDLFTYCAAASATRMLSVLQQVQLQWDSPTLGLLLPCLRPACEDLIVLEYLRGIPSDREAIIEALISESIGEAINAQKDFFAAERSWQPIMRKPLPAQNPEVMAAIGSRLGWPKRNKQSRFPTTYWMSQEVQMKPLYKFVYKMTSNVVHFNPQTLLRFCWANNTGVNVAIEGFGRYYREALVIYGCYLYGLFANAMKDELGLSTEHVSAVETMNVVLRAHPRWPEMVTFEECNMETPDHVGAWREFMQSHPIEDVRRIFR